MRRKLNEYFVSEAKRQLAAIRSLTMQQRTEDEIVQWLSNRVAVVYFEGRTDGLLVSERGETKGGKTDAVI